MTERWGLCDRCDRWFYASDAATSDDARCPVCDGSAAELSEGRPATSALS